MKHVPIALLDIYINSHGRDLPINIAMIFGDKYTEIKDYIRVSAVSTHQSEPKLYSIDENISAELVKLLYAQAKTAIGGSLITASCIVVGLFSAIPRPILFTWYALLIIVSIIRYGMVSAYFYAKPDVAQTAYWKKIFLIATVISGLTWMLAGTVLLPAGTIYQTLITFAIAGIVSGSVPYFSASKIVSATFILLVLPAFALRMILEGDKQHQLLGTLAIIYSVVLIFSAFRNHSAIYSALKLKFENLELIQRLSATKNVLQLEIREREQIEKLLRNSEEQYRLVTDALPVLIAYIDRNMCFRFANKPYTEWFNKSLTEIMGEPIKDIFGEGAFGLFNECYQQVLNGKQMSYETTLYLHEDQERYVSVTLIPHVIDNAVHGVFSLISDMTPRINYLATHDSLTGLPNRSLFNERLSRALKYAHRNSTQLVLLFLDLDHFKNVNDTLGHDVGDQLLIRVVERLKNCVEENDTIARLGGDEFIIILENIPNIEHVIATAKRLCKSLSEVYHIDDKRLYITTSIGISTYPNDGDNMQMLLKNADMAMYRAKERGRNMFEFYTRGMNEAIQKKANIETNLRKALENDEFKLHYQPVIDIKNNKIVCVEALIRWNNPEMGFVSPGEFIPIAEESDLIVNIGEWVLKTACQQNLIWQREQFKPVRISVNLSARQFMHHDLVDTIANTLKQTGLDGKYLTLEVTESLIMEDVDHSIKMLNALKALDVSIAIDDFGTGYSSLNYLKRFPFDIIKIDRTFITDFTANHDDAAIVKAIIALAHTLKMKVIAEGVEKPEQFNFLRDHGCDEIQGFLFYPPLSEMDMEMVLMEFNMTTQPHEMG